MTTNNRFPRLLYVGDVPVEAGVGGSAFVYRLLQTYPQDCLRIVEGSIWHSAPEKRLPKVQYGRLALGPSRPLYTRFGSQYAAYLFLAAGAHSLRLHPIVKEFAPEAILTVAHGFLWRTAAQLASRLHIPLHLNINDDWTAVNPLPPKMRNFGKRKFGEVYKMAATRRCASPYMVESYEKEFGVTGEVLYPPLAVNQVQFESAPATNGKKGGIVFAFAGSIHSQAYADSLINLASALEQSASSVIAYCGLSAEGIQRFGLSRPNLSILPLIPATELLASLRNNANALFVPMSFESVDRANMKAGFPSKLPDYTAIGLPLLIWGPRDCSAVRWARENPGVAEIVEENDLGLLAAAVNRIVSSSEYRRKLGMTALIKCSEYFAHSAVTERFYNGILK